MCEKKRGSNFNLEESTILNDLVSEKYCVLKSKKPDSLTWKMKKIAWCEIANEFNAKSLGPFRTAQQLRTKYENMKSATKKKMKDKKTGLKPHEEKIKEMILRENALCQENLTVEEEFDVKPIERKKNEIEISEKERELRKAKIDLLNLQLKLMEKQHELKRDQHHKFMEMLQLKHQIKLEKLRIFKELSTGF